MVAKATRSTKLSITVDVMARPISSTVRAAVSACAAAARTSRRWSASTVSVTSWSSAMITCSPPGSWTGQKVPSKARRGTPAGAMTRTGPTTTPSSSAVRTNPSQASLFGPKASRGVRPRCSATEPPLMAASASFTYRNSRLLDRTATPTGACSMPPANDVGKTVPSSTAPASTVSHGTWPGPRSRQRALRPGLRGCGVLRSPLAAQQQASRGPYDPLVAGDETSGVRQHWEAIWSTKRDDTLSWSQSCAEP